MVVIREAIKADVGGVFALIRAKAEFDGCLDLLQSKQSEIDDAFFSDAPKAKALVALVDGKVIGLATYYPIYSTFLAKPGIWLDDLYIYPEFRQQGIGKQLISKLCVIAKQTGCGRIDWIVARDNANGRAFYETMGASIFEEVRHSRLDEKTIHLLAS